MNTIAIRPRVLNRAEWLTMDRPRQAQPGEGEQRVAEPAIFTDATDDDNFLGAYVPAPMTPAECSALAMRILRLELGHRKIGQVKQLTPDPSSRTYGYRSRLVIGAQEACQACGIAHEDPEANDALCMATHRMEEAFAAVAPAVHEAQASRTERLILPAWRIGRLYTQGIVNVDFAIPYHLDRGNLPHTFSSQLCLRSVKGGGDLVMPEWNVRLACDDGWLAIFDGGRWIHGVTPIVSLPGGKAQHRISIVAYCLDAMRHCLPPAQELARAQRKRTEREQARAVSDHGRRTANRPAPDA